MITKNEEKFLEKCLNSVKELVDEIIIVDTGSTDKTIEIAKNFTNNIFYFEWCDDFSKARNESLKYATKEWILVLDADEIISHKDHAIIKEIIQKEKVAGYTLVQRNYTNDSTHHGFIFNRENISESKDYLGWIPSGIVRLFINNPKIYFQGEVHELVEDSINEINQNILPIQIPIHHYGEQRSEEIKRRKLHYYQELCNKKIKNNPSNYYAYFQLGVQCKELNQLLQAEENFNKSLEINSNQPYVLLNLAIVQQKQNKLDEAIHNYLKMLSLKDNFAEAYFGLGFCYFKKNVLQKAKDNFLLAIKYKPTHIDAHINLGAIYEKMNQFNLSSLCYKKALEINPRNPRIYYNLGVIHERTVNLSMAIKCYEKAVELNYVNKEYLIKRISEIKEFINKQKIS